MVFQFSFYYAIDCVILIKLSFKKLNIIKLPTTVLILKIQHYCRKWLS